jgi:hypothetical protein
MYLEKISNVAEVVQYFPCHWFVLKTFFDVVQRTLHMAGILLKNVYVVSKK